MLHMLFDICQRVYTLLRRLAMPCRCVYATPRFAIRIIHIEESTVQQSTGRCYRLRYVQQRYYAPYGCLRSLMFYAHAYAEFCAVIRK